MKWQLQCFCTTEKRSAAEGPADEARLSRGSEFSETACPRRGERGASAACAHLFGEHSAAGSVKIPGHFSATAGCRVEREQSAALTPRVTPGCRSQPHTGTRGCQRHPRHLRAGGLWDTEFRHNGSVLGWSFQFLT